MSAHAVLLLPLMSASAADDETGVLYAATATDDE